jgi:phosphinothricin acetyltransferase
MQFRNADLEEILAIYNYHVKNSFAAYPEKELDKEIFNLLIQEAISCYVLKIDNEVGGYAILRNYLPYENFKHTGKLTYFLKTEYTNKGFGTKLFRKLIDDAIDYGINTIYVHLSSRNPQSLNFHKKLGFKECGRFRNVAKKFNQKFDIIWMELLLEKG